MTSSRSASYFPVTPGALFSELKWTDESDFNQFTNLTSGDSENSRIFRRSLLTIKFADVVTIGGQRFAIAIGNPNEPTVSQSIFGVAAALQSPLTTTPETRLDGITAFSALDPRVAPTTAYSVTQLPQTATFGGMAVFGGINYSPIPGDFGGVKQQVDNSDVLIFGVWDNNAIPASITSRAGLEIVPYPSSSSFSFGWYRVPQQTGRIAPPPRSLAAAAAVNVGIPRGDRMFIFGGVNGSGLSLSQTGVAVEKSTGNVKLTAARDQIERARELLSARSGDLKSVSGATLILFAETVLVLCARVDDLDTQVGSLEEIYIKQAETTYTTALKALNSYPFGFPLLDLAKEALDDLLAVVTKPLPSGSSKLQEISFMASVARIRIAAEERANNLITEISNELGTSAGEFIAALKESAAAALYVSRYGDARQSTDVYRDAWLFDYITGEWDEVIVPGNIAPRFAASAQCSWDMSRVYIFGGVRIGTSRPFGQVWEMRARDRRWSLIYAHDPENQTLLPGIHLRHAASTCVPDGSIIFHGGFASCVASDKLLAAEFEPENYLSEENERDCSETSAAFRIADGRTPSRVVSDAVWVFSPPGFAASKNSASAKWVEVPTISQEGAPDDSVRSNAFHCSVLSDVDDFKKTYTLTYIGGVNVVRNVGLSAQHTVEALASEFPYPIASLVTRKIGTAPIEIGAAADLTIPVTTSSDNAVFMFAVILSVVWIAIIIVSLILAFK